MMNAWPPGSSRIKLAALAFLIAVLAIQPPSSRAQTGAQAAAVAALIDYPTFYVDRTIVVRGHLRDTNGRLSFEDDDGHRVTAAWRPQERPDTTVDATGVLWDLGRMKQDDGRLAGYDVTSIVGVGGQEWPRPGDLFVFAVTRFAPAEASPGTTIRSLVLEGARAAGRQATVVGQFHGHNLFGELPRAPGVNRREFVVRSADAAIWVTGMQPRGKDFDFDPDKRVDSNRWLEVTGIVRENRGLTWIEATRLSLSQPGTTQPADAATQPKPIAPFPPPEVLFSVPAQGETDVNPTVAVRIQLSRAVNRSSLVGHIRAGYLGPAAGQITWITSEVDLEERNDAPGGAIAVLRITFAQPLDGWRSVRIELLDGIKATDGQLLKPWQLTFTVGGQ
jgi:hypothetical protein